MVLVTYFAVKAGGGQQRGGAFLGSRQQVQEGPVCRERQVEEGRMQNTERTEKSSGLGGC